jgi:AsmA-like protein
VSIHLISPLNYKKIVFILLFSGQKPTILGMPETKKEAKKETEPAKRKPIWRRVLRVIGKVFLWLIGILLGLLVLAWLALLIFFPDDKIRRMLVADLEQRLGVEVQAESLDLEILSGLSLNNVSIGAPPGFVKPPLKIRQLVIDYSLIDILKKKLIIRNILIEQPEFFLTEAKGRTNIAALIAQMQAGQEEEAAQTPAEDEDQDGFILDLEQIRIENAKITIETGALTADLSGLGVTLNGRLGAPSQTYLKVHCELQAPDSSNLHVAGEQALDGSLGLVVDLDIDGLGQLQSSGQASFYLPGKKSEEQPKIVRRELKVGFDTNLSLAEDQAVLKSLTVSLDNDLLATAFGRVDDLDGQLLAEMEIKSAKVPLDMLTDYLAEKMPLLKLAGNLSIESATFKGSLTGGLPKANASLVLEQVNLALAGLAVQNASGKLSLAFEPDELGGSYEIDGGISAGLLQGVGWRAAETNLQLGSSGTIISQADGWRINEPLLTFKTAAKKIELAELKLGPTWLSGRLFSSGEALLINSDEISIPEVRLKAKGASSSLRRAGLLVRGPGLELDLKFEAPDLSPASGPSVAKLKGRLQVQAQRVASAGLVVNRPLMTADLQGWGLTFGKRFKKPARLQLMLRTGAVMFKGATIQTIQGRSRLSLAGPSISNLPISTSLIVDGLAVEEELIFGSGASSTSGLVVPPFTVPGQVKIDYQGVVAPALAHFKIGRLTTSIADLVSVSATGELDLSGGQSAIDLHIAQLELGRVLAALPTKFSKLLPGVSGRLEIKTNLRGRLAAEEISIDKMPLDIEATVFLMGVGLTRPLYGLQVKELSGQAKFTLPKSDRRNIQARLNLTVARLIQNSGLPELQSVSLALDARVDGSDLSLKGRVGVAKLGVGKLLPHPLTNIKLTFDSRLLGMKDLRLASLRLGLPSLGFDLDMDGRITRRLEADWLSGSKVSCRLKARLYSQRPISLPGHITCAGEAEVDLAVESVGQGILETRGKVALTGLDLQGSNFVLQGMQGGVSTAQLIAWYPSFGLLAKSPTPNELPKGQSVKSTQSRAYDEALRPMKGQERTFSIKKVQYQDLVFENLTGNLELGAGRLSLGSLRFSFLAGDVLADAGFVFAPRGKNQLTLDAEMSGVDLAGLGALSLTGSSDISGNLRLSLNRSEKTVAIAVNLTQIGRSTLQALLVALDPTESNPGVMELRGFLTNYKVSPKRVSLNIRRGLLDMEVVLKLGMAARAAAGLIKGFKGDTFPLKHLPIGGLLSKYMGF